MQRLITAEPAQSPSAVTAAGVYPLLLPLAIVAVMWTLIPALVHTAPPLDVVESALWGREWVVGTYKHPAMPAWLIEVGRGLNSGRIGWPVYATGQLFNLATLALTYLLARDLAGPRVATAAVLALLGVEYFSWRSFEFNHTQAQFPFWVGSAWCAWRAIDRKTVGWWLALGALAAVGLYAKLSNAMLLLVIAGWIVSSPRGRASCGTLGPWAGALLFAALCVPLGQWLIASHFQSFDYARDRAHEMPTTATLLFPVNALLQFVPVVLMLALSGLFTRTPAGLAHSQPQTPEAKRFLLVTAILPAALSVGLALINGSGIRATWVAPSIPLLTVLLAAHLAGRLTDRVLARLGTIGLALALVVPLGYAVVAPQVGRYTAVRPLRVNWPQVRIAQTLSSIWTAETGKPLRIVAGDAWIAGLVGLDHPDRPSIFTQGRFGFAPWITPERLRREGALAVWIEGRGATRMPELDKLVASLPIKEVHIASPREPPGHEVVLKYAILPPE